MSKEIEEFIEYLKQEAKKTLPYNAKNGDNNIFKVQRYEHEKYNCELSQMLSGDKEAIDTFKEVYSKKYFELKHPFKNDIITRAVYTNILEKLGFYGIFFIDKDNKFPWILNLVLFAMKVFLAIGNFCIIGVMGKRLMVTFGGYISLLTIL